MKINEQLFEDVLSGKLKGKFVLRSGSTFHSSLLSKIADSRYPYMLDSHSYTSEGILIFNSKTHPLNIEDFIPDTDMKENELTIEIPNGKIVDWDESKKQNKIVFKKTDTKPRSWEEYCEQHNTTVTNRYFIDNGADVRVAGWHPDIPSDMLKNTLPSKELAEAFLAMMQLMSLRQEWIGGWKPEWSSDIDKIWCIVFRNCKLNVDFFLYNANPLSFPTEEMALDFMNTFKDLLEVAKPLI